jgi:hypothetical protein
MAWRGPDQDCAEWRSETFTGPLRPDAKVTDSCDALDAFMIMQASLQCSPKTVQYAYNKVSFRSLRFLFSMRSHARSAQAHAAVPATKQALAIFAMRYLGPSELG